jgi:penicillin-binding protein 2
VALIVENGGFGAQAAAPIARKVFDYVLLGKVPGEAAGPRGAAHAPPKPNPSPTRRTRRAREHRARTRGPRRREPTQ